MNVPAPVTRYPKRNRQPPTSWYRVTTARLNALDGLTDCPLTYKEAVARPDADLWREAIHVELAALWEKGVYEECTLPAGKKALPAKMVYNIKRDQLGNIDK